MSLLPLWGPRQVQERAGSLVIIIILTTLHYLHLGCEDGNHLHGQDHLIMIGQFSLLGAEPTQGANILQPQM